MVKANLSGASKQINFMQSRLRSGKDILKRGGVVTSTFTEMKYSFEADPKRIFEDWGGKVSRWTSAAPPSIETCELLAGISKLGKRQ